VLGPTLCCVVTKQSRQGGARAQLETWRQIHNRQLLTHLTTSDRFNLQQMAACSVPKLASNPEPTAGPFRTLGIVSSRPGRLLFVNNRIHPQSKEE
jgi:hypothetical protein